ncbi:MAG TPA: hypothetical protein VMR74_07240 [Gammaproteobacteria bacterium]|nr:hypothetical protein [Gammaproteobacteria bacterium]
MKRIMKQLGATTALGAAVFAVAASAQSPACDETCLNNNLTERYLEALLAQDWSGLPWANRVGHTENDVGLMIGEGLWGTATAIGEGFTVADPSTGNVVWLGIVEEHGQAAYIAIRLAVDGTEISEVEVVAGRDGPPAPFAPTDGYRVHRSFTEALPADQRLPRERMIALVEGYYNTMQLNDGKIFTEIADDCSRVTNGQSTTHGEDIDIEGCRQQFEAGWYRPVDRVRSRRFPIVDEERGIVVALAFLDHATRYVEYETLDGRARSIPLEYPNTHGVLELFKIEGGAITRVEGVTSFQPYLMPTPWLR